MYVLDINFTKERSIVESIFNHFGYKVIESTDKKNFSCLEDIEWNPKSETLFWNPQKIKKGSFFAFVSRILSSSPNELDEVNFRKNHPELKLEDYMFSIYFLIVFQEFISRSWVIETANELLQHELGAELIDVPEKSAEEIVIEYLKNYYKFSKEVRYISEIRNSMREIGVVDKVRKDLGFPK